MLQLVKCVTSCLFHQEGYVFHQMSRAPSAYDLSLQLVFASMLRALPAFQLSFLRRFEVEEVSSLTARE